MRINCVLALCAVVLGTGGLNSSASQQPSSGDAPFTLQITANLKNDHFWLPDFTSTSIKTVKAGFPIYVVIKKTNESGQEIIRRPNYAEPYGYDFDVRDANGDPLTPKPPRNPLAFGGPSIRGPSTLQPGEADIKTVNITTLYDFSKPGKYTIQVSQPTSDDPNSTVVRSNAIVVEVLPAS